MLEVIEKRTGNLPDAGAKIFEKVYKDAKANGKDDEYAAKVSWTAVHNAGWVKDGDKWVKNKSEIVTFSMAIVKASFDKGNQVMRWRAVASDTDPDLYEEKMSLELFSDFVHRINDKIPVPEEFESAICEEEWCGGTPYLSIAHYKSGEQSKNVPGKIESVYLDGTRLKSTGFLNNTPLGKAVFDSMNKDLYAMKSDGQPEVPPEERIRISIGFLDLQHKHIPSNSIGNEFTFTRSATNNICPLCEQGIGGKIYMKGQLVHEALTRVPVNPRTAMEVERSMNIVTKADDAASIVGDDLAQTLVDSMSEKSQAAGTSDGLVTKANITSDPEPSPDECDKCYDDNTGMYDQECIDSVMAGNGALEFVHPALPKDSDLKKDGPLSPKSEVYKAMTKSEAWGDEPSSSYLIVGDPKHPTSWHLPVKKHGKVDRGLMGAAHAALVSEGGHRGNSYEGPGKAKAIAKLKSLYKSQGMDWETKSLTEEAMKLGNADVEEKKFKYDGVSGDPGAGTKVAPKASKAEKADEAEDAKDSSADEAAEGEPAEAKKKKMQGKSLLDVRFEQMKSKIDALIAEGVSGEDALKAVQAEFNGVADAVQKSFAPTGDLGDIAAVVRSAVSESLAPMAQRLAVVEAQLAVRSKTDKRAATPVSRAITRPNDLLQKKSGPVEGGQQLTQIQKLARHSVGLPSE
jgi:hypothetical protein